MTESAFGVDHGDLVSKASFAGIGSAVARGTRRAGIKTMRAGNKRGYVRGSAASVPAKGVSGSIGRAVSQGGRKLIETSGTMNRNTEMTGYLTTGAAAAGGGTAVGAAANRRRSN